MSRHHFSDYYQFNWRSIINPEVDRIKQLRWFLWVLGLVLMISGLVLIYSMLTASLWFWFSLIWLIAILGYYLAVWEWSQHALSHSQLIRYWLSRHGLKIDNLHIKLDQIHWPEDWSDLVDELKIFLPVRNDKGKIKHMPIHFPDKASVQTFIERISKYR